MKNINIFLSMSVKYFVILLTISCFQITLGAPSAVKSEEKKNSATTDSPKLTKREMSAVVKVVTLEDRTHEIIDDDLYIRVSEMIKEKPFYPPNTGLDLPPAWVYCNLKMGKDKNRSIGLTLFPLSYIIRIEETVNIPEKHTTTTTFIGWYKSPEIWNKAKEAVLHKVDPKK